MGKRKGSKPQYTKATSKIQKTAAITKEEEKKRTNIAKHSTFITIFVVLVLVFSFAGRWIYAIQKNYFGTFVEVDFSAQEALENIDALSPSSEESELLLPYQTAFDLFKASRLCDEVSMTAQDGVSLHGYLYNEESDKTVIVLQSFGISGKEDFLPIAALSQTYDCNFLLLDARASGESQGDYFSYGYHEQDDLAEWIAWADQKLGKQSYLIWGIGAGANTALFADENSLLPDSVAAIVAENPYASLHELAKKNIRQWYTLPAFPFLNAIELRVNLSKTDFTVDDVNLESVLSNTPEDIPLLFLSSDGDQYIQKEFTMEAYQLFSGEKELICGSGSHGTVYAEKEAEILAWIAKKWK